MERRVRANPPSEMVSKRMIISVANKKGKVI